MNSFIHPYIYPSTHSIFIKFSFCNTRWLPRNDFCRRNAHSWLIILRTSFTHRTSEWLAFLSPDPTWALPGVRHNDDGKDKLLHSQNLLVDGGQLRQTHLRAIQHDIGMEKNTKERRSSFLRVELEELSRRIWKNRDMVLHIHIVLSCRLRLIGGEVIKAQRDEVIGFLWVMHYAESSYLFLYLTLTATL